MTAPDIALACRSGSASAFSVRGALGFGLGLVAVGYLSQLVRRRSF